MACTAAQYRGVCVCLFLIQLSTEQTMGPSSPPSLELSSSVQLCLPRLHWHGFPQRPGSAVPVYIAGVTALCTAVTLHAHKERPVFEADQELGSKLQILQPVHLTRWLQGGSEI